MRILYKANAYAAIAIGAVFVLFGYQLRGLYAGSDAAVDLIRVVGLAGIAVAIVTLTVMRSAGQHFMALARPSFGAAFFIIAPITTLAFAKFGAGRVVFVAQAGLIMALCYRPEFSTKRVKRDIVSDWQEEIRETAS